MNKKYILKIGIIFIVALSFASGCRQDLYQDISNSFSSQQLSLPSGEFESVAWLDENHIAFIYRPEELIPDDLGKDFSINIFEISSGKTITLPNISIPSSCFPPSTISELTRLPDGSLGFVFRCRSENGVSGTLFMWDVNQNTYIELQTYPEFLARNFSFSPDMSKLIQENGVGGGLNNELYLVDSQNGMTKLLLDFKRARSPAWSSDGKTIAFAGTKENPENTDTNTWPEIESLFYYPWDIYLMDADGSNARILLPLVGNVYDLKWSPTDSNFLLFGGTAFDDADGVWLLDISDKNVKRIWAENTRFDWSPDGSKIVVLDNNTGTRWTGATIIDITKQ
jgi:Tol biopolymer transport system component